MKVAESQFNPDAAAQRAIESNSGMTELQNNIDAIDRQIKALQEKLTELRKQQRSIMQKAITKALQGGS